MAAQILQTIAGAASAPLAETKNTPKPRASSSCLVPLRAGGSAAPLFCIHPAGGLVNIYEPLAKQLPPELPMHGIQSQALAGAESEHASVVAMAQHYASLISENQPHGPIRLLGFSFGGFMAIAVARTLEAAGRSVAFVGVIDADLRWTGKNYLKQEFLRRHIIEMHATMTRELGLLKPLDARALDEFANELATEITQGTREERMDRVLRSIAAHGYVLPGLPDSLLRQYLSLYFAHLDLLADCAPSVISAPLAVWSGRETGGGSSGWRRFTTGRFSEAFLDGAHYDLMYPPLAGSLARQLADALKKTVARRSKKEPVLVPA
jgi:thioesterase domain-containing protein